MTYITKSITIIITLYMVINASTTPYTYDYYPIQNTRNVTTRQGILRGVVHGPKVNRNLPLVEVYLGIPYAAPPVGEFRFMPPGSAPSWGKTIKYADTFGPVCPQKFPDERKMTHFRKEYFLRLKQYLRNQSEDCLYLNIYAPFQGWDGTFGFVVKIQNSLPVIKSLIFLPTYIFLTQLTSSREYEDSSSFFTDLVSETYVRRSVSDLVNGRLFWTYTSKLGRQCN